MNDKNALAYAQLQFQVEVPNLEETWLDGYQAGMKEQAEESNPYAMDSKEYALWNEGWWAGFYQEEPLFSLDGTVHAKQTKAQVMQAEKKAEKSVSKIAKMPGKYIIRTIQIFGAILAAAVCYQLADLVI